MRALGAVLCHVFRDELAVLIAAGYVQRGSLGLVAALPRRGGGQKSLISACSLGAAFRPVRAFAAPLTVE